ncbi:MAG: ATP-binding protein, partial [Blastocatellia bacterium]
FNLDAAPVVGSASQLREVFVNLIFNALDAMAGRGGRLEIQTGLSEGMAFARFTDEGVGILPEIRDRLFEPFFTTKGAAGTGLGLSGSRAIVERHGGRIDVNSESAKGATFIVSLPGAITAEQYDRHEKPAPAQETENGILIIDDNPEELNEIHAALDSRGRAAKKAAGMDEGCGMLGKDPRRYLVALVALRVPAADLLPFLSQLKDLSPRIRLVVLWESADLLAGQPGARSSIDMMITRPFKEETLLLALERALL